MIDVSALTGGLDVKSWLAATAAAAGAGAALWAVGKYLPGLVAKKLHAAFDAAKSSGWFKDPKHPTRARWLLATAAMLEEEIPNPGDGEAVYLGFGIWAARHLKLGKPEAWAKAARLVGDAVDLELGEEIKELASPSVVEQPKPEEGGPATFA